jgi:hypothetical protein
MTETTKKKLITTNAAIWAVGILASFILPLVTQSLSDGPGNFLQVLAQVGPLIVAMFLSTAALNRSVVAAPE